MFCVFESFFSFNKIVKSEIEFESVLCPLIATSTLMYTSLLLYEFLFSYPLLPCVVVFIKMFLTASREYGGEREGK